MSYYSSIYKKVSNFILGGNPYADIATKEKELYQDVWRIICYRQYWAHWKNLKTYIRKPGASTPIQLNLSRAFINRSIDFLIGKPFQVVPDKKYAKVVNNYLKYINDKMDLSVCHLETVTAGSIKGDAILKVMWDRGTQSPRFQALDPERVFLQYADTSKSRTNLLKAVITWEGYYDFGGARGNEWVLYKEEWTDLEIKRGIEYPRIAKSNKKKDSFFSMEKINAAFSGASPIQDTVFETLELKTEKNDLGFIPIVHFRNQLEPLELYGRSDLEDIVQISTSLNETVNLYKASVDYAGNPVTIVKGEKIANLRRGVNNIWGGFKKDSDVFNLGGKDDFPAIKELMDRLTDYAFMIGSIPEAYSGLFQNISNTTGVALQVQYLPIIGLTNRKRITYGVGFAQAYEYALRILDQGLGLNAQTKIDDFVKKQEELALSVVPPESEDEGGEFLQKQEELLKEMLIKIPKKDYYNVSIKWGDFLPKDDLLTLDKIEREIDSGLESVRGAMERLGVDDPDDKIREIKNERDSEVVNFRAEKEDLEEGGIFGSEGQGKDPAGATAEGSQESQDRKEINEKKSDEQKDANIAAGKQKRK